MYKVEFLERDYDRVWDDFCRMCEFKPSVEPRGWPGIEEQTPSFTIFLTESDYSICPDQEELSEYFAGIFNRLSGKAKISYILDWNHACFHVPKMFNDKLWVYPDGDYAIYLNEDLSCVQKRITSCLRAM
jgi:hypothetical protein